MENTVTGKQKLLVCIAHLSYFLSGFGFVVAPLILYLVVEDDAFIKEHARQALICHVTLAVVFAALAVLGFIGGLAWLIDVVIGIVYCWYSIKATLAGCRGVAYVYPFMDKSPVTKWVK